MLCAAFEWVIDTTEEGGGSVGTDGSLDQVGSSRVVFGERRAVVDESVDSNERSLLGLSLEVLPRDDRELVARLGPLDLLGLLLEGLQLHGVLSLLDLVVGESLEVRSETKRRHGPDEPLGGVVLEPLDGVSEVHGELVVEVVVALTDGAEGGDKVVTRGVLVVEGLVSEPVSKRVDAEGRVVHKAQSSGTGEEESSPPVSPSESGNESREGESHEEEQGEVVLVLPLDDLVSGQVGDIGDTDLSSRLDDHPSDVGPPETLVGRVRVELGVGVSVVGSVSSGPPFDGSLNGTSTSDREGVLERDRGVVSSVSPQSVVTGGDTETGDVVVDDTREDQFFCATFPYTQASSPPDGRLAVVRGGHHSVNGNGRGDGDGEEGDPLDVPDQVLPGDGGKVLLLLDGGGNVVVRDIRVARHERRLDRLDTSKGVDACQCQWQV